jgi:AraC-like DNA-binding protein
MRVQTSLPEEFYAVAVSLEGNLEHVLARKSFMVNPDLSLIQSPLHTSVVTTPDRYELVFIRIGRFFITNELQNLLDRQLGAGLLFKPPMAMQTTAGRAFRNLVFQLFHELHGSDRGTAVPFRVAHLKSALVSLLLQSQRHNYTQLLNRFSAAGSWQLRIAEEYVQEHAHLPITLGDLSAISGVSSRTLQHSFQRKNGCGPMQFLRAIRMQKARTDLLNSAGGETVSEIAARWGFLHFGRFAQDYRALFQEYPSDTRRASAPRLLLKKAAVA